MRVSLKKYYKVLLLSGDWTYWINCHKFKSESKNFSSKSKSALHNFKDSSRSMVLVYLESGEEQHWLTDSGGQTF